MIGHLIFSIWSTSPHTREFFSNCFNSAVFTRAALVLFIANDLQKLFQSHLHNGCAGRPVRSGVLQLAAQEGERLISLCLIYQILITEVSAFSPLYAFEGWLLLSSAAGSYQWGRQGRQLLLQLLWGGMKSPYSSLLATCTAALFSQRQALQKNE